MVRWLHALRICESVGTGPLWRSGIVRRCAHGKAIRMMQMHGRYRRALSFACWNKGKIRDKKHTCEIGRTFGEYISSCFKEQRIRIRAREFLGRTYV